MCENPDPKDVQTSLLGSVAPEPDSDEEAEFYARANFEAVACNGCGCYHTCDVAC